MPIAPIFNGTIEKGKFIPINKEKFIVHCCGLEGKPIEVIVRRRYSQKSDKQNRYYRGIVVVLIGQAMGYRNTSTELEKVHGILLDKFFKEIDEKGNTYIRSTRLDKWKTIEWENKMGEIRQWASEFLGIYIPKPNEAEQNNA